MVDSGSPIAPLAELSPSSETTAWRRLTRKVGRLLAISAAVAALPVASASAATSSATYVPTGASVGSGSSTASPDLLYDGTAALNAGQMPFSYQSYVAGHVTVVPDPTGLPRNVMRLAVADSDRPYSGASNPRADFETPGYFTNSSDLYYSIEFMLPQGFPTLTSSGWYQISEIYGPPHGGSPPIGIDLVPGANGRPRPAFQRDANYGYDKPWIGPTLDAGWHQIVVHTRSATDSSGFVEIWLDGQPQTMSNGQTQVSYPTLASGINWDGQTPNVLNVNSYRQAGAYPGTVTMYQAAAKVGTSLASVMDMTPLSGTAPPSGTAPLPGTPPLAGTASLPGTAQLRALLAAFTAPSVSTRGRPVTFDASSSTGSPVSYLWTNGTRTLGTGQTLSLTFHDVGTRHVKLTVTNASGATASAEHDHVVVDRGHQRRCMARRHRRYSRGRGNAHQRLTAARRHSSYPGSATCPARPRRGAGCGQRDTCSRGLGWARHHERHTVKRGIGLSRGRLTRRSPA